MYCIYILLISLYINVVFQQSIYVQVKELTLSCKFRLAPACTGRFTTSASPWQLDVQIAERPFYKNRVRQIQLDQNTFIGKIYIHIHIIYVHIMYTHQSVHIHCIHIHIHIHLYIQLQLQQITCKLTLLTISTHTYTQIFSSLLLSSLVPYY